MAKIRLILQKKGDQLIFTSVHPKAQAFHGRISFDLTGKDPKLSISIVLTSRYSDICNNIESLFKSKQESLYLESFESKYRTVGGGMDRIRKFFVQSSITINTDKTIFSTPEATKLLNDLFDSMFEYIDMNEYDSDVFNEYCKSNGFDYSAKLNKLSTQKASLVTPKIESDYSKADIQRPNIRVLVNEKDNKLNFISDHPDASAFQGKILFDLTGKDSKLSILIINTSSSSKVCNKIEALFKSKQESLFLESFESKYRTIGGGIERIRKFFVQSSITINTDKTIFSTPEAKKLLHDLFDSIFECVSMNVQDIEVFNKYCKTNGLDYQVNPNFWLLQKSSDFNPGIKTDSNSEFVQELISNNPM